MDFETLSKIGSLLSRPFAKDLLRLLVTYETLSASEAASRLNLHIRTAQDFLEGLTARGIAKKEEVFEGKRPYYRYALGVGEIQLSYDLKRLAEDGDSGGLLDGMKIRERKNANCTFKTSPRGDAISAVILFSGKGRDRQERRIRLTARQGRLLFHLPFPTEEPRTLRGLLEKAGIGEAGTPEILDIIRFLHTRGVIESHPRREVSNRGKTGSRRKAAKGEPESSR